MKYQKKIQWVLMVAGSVAMPSFAQAAVVTFEQVGPDVSVSFSGSLTVPGMLDQLVITNANSQRNTSNVALFSLSSQNEAAHRFLIIDPPNGPVITDLAITPNPGTFVPRTFGFNDTLLAVPFSEFLPDSEFTFTYSPLDILTFSDTTLLDLGAANFNNTLAFSTGATTNGDIFFTTIVPEPSSTSLLGLASLGLAFRRTRK